MMSRTTILLSIDPTCADGTSRGSATVSGRRGCDARSVRRCGLPPTTWASRTPIRSIPIKRQGVGRDARELPRILRERRVVPPEVEAQLARLEQDRVRTLPASA
jgi:hypothetical protein